MQAKADLLNELQNIETNFHTSTAPEEKIEVFRRKAIILDELTRVVSEPQILAVLRAQFTNQHFTGDNLYKTFIKSRCAKVQKPPKGTSSRRCSIIGITADQFLKRNKHQIEPTCSGKYNSCNKTEVNGDDLKMFPKKLPNQMEGKSLSPVREIRSDSDLKNVAPVEESKSKVPGFRTAREELFIQNAKKNGFKGSSSSHSAFNYGATKKSLGARRNVRANFVPPVRQENKSNFSPSCIQPDAAAVCSSPEPEDERLKNIDPKMIELISNEIMHTFKPICWKDIAGLEYAKSILKEAVVWPLLRPDIFTGLRRPPRGVLLFGPPGTGKTLIGKCIACQSKATFFSISASSLTSKWVGDGEKMVRALFAVAAVRQPSVIFIDEIDSLLTQRSTSDHESSRRLKTELLVQLDGATTTGEERILVVGATNRPGELDEAARRRMVRRLYIPLPELAARVQILKNLLQTVRNVLQEHEIEDIGNRTEGYSGSDMEMLCREASMEPIRSIPVDEIPYFNEANVRPVRLEDFVSALTKVRASVSPSDLEQYVDWNRVYGSGQ